ncbi:MAG: hypothetical protein AAFY41_16730, partial [Bacteroidota bacterium]
MVIRVFAKFLRYVSTLGSIQEKSTVNKSDRIYLRAYHIAANDWSNRYGNDAPFVDVEVLEVETPTIRDVSNNNCGEKFIRRPSYSSRDATWYWQGTDPAGTSTEIADERLYVSESGTYYLRALSNEGCWGESVSVEVVVNSYPVMPAEPTIEMSCGYTTLTRSEPPEGVTWYWQTRENVLNIDNADENFVVTKSGTYYLTARSDAGCWNRASETKTINVTV